MLITKNVKSDTKNMNNEMYIASDFVTFEQARMAGQLRLFNQAETLHKLLH